MSWLEKVKTGLKIKCGDGKVYEPNYLSPQKTIEFNISSFNFPDINGTLIRRKAAMGFKYPIEFYFQGENHLDTSVAFEQSSLDPRPWTISHPYYGDLTVHPASLSFDNSQHNVTKITGQLLETISTVRPTAVDSPVEKIAEAKVSADTEAASAFANQVDLTTQDVTSLQTQNNILYAEGKGSALGLDGSTYFNAFSTANSAISSATSEPLQAMTTIQAMISAPGRFASSVTQRQTTLTTQFQRIIETVVNLVTPNQKRQFQATGGTLITTMCESLSTGEYTTTNDVILQIESLLANYETFVVSIDSIQTANGGEPDSYVPDQSVMLAIDDIVNLTATTLFEIAMSAQQERTLILENDSNAILLTHRFYGLDDNDENLNRFVNSNNLSFTGHLLIRKGTKIVYFV